MQCIEFSFPDLPHVRCVFTTRHDGNISYDIPGIEQQTTASRQRIQERTSMPGWVELTQVHGDTMHMDLPPAPFPHKPTLKGDGLGTSLPGVPLCIKTADCQPVLLAHTSGKYVAGLHAGWRGNHINFPASGVRQFCDHYQLNPAEVLAVRGPSLGPGAAEFTDFSVWGSSFSTFYNTARKTMDLWQLTRAQLEDAGLLPRHIFGIDLCTLSLSRHFFSYRHNKHCGRQGSFIWIEKQ